MNMVDNVTVGKPRISGGIWRAPLGTPLPTDARSALSGSFKTLGYVSEDGVTNENTADTESTQAWGGDTVLETQTGKPDTFSFTLIEAMNTEVLKLVYGNNNVTGDISTGITIKANSEEQEECVLVIDMKLKGGALKRIVIPDAKVTEVGEIEYNNSDPVGYETTVSCLPDDAGNTHYEYIIKAGNTGVTVEAESGSTVVFGTNVSDLQSDVSIADGIITGTLKYLGSGALVDTWGAGNFIALKFSGDAFDNATSIKVGMSPSQGSGLVEVINDPDRNGAFKVTSTTQTFVVEVTSGTETKKATYDLTGLTLLGE